MDIDGYMRVSQGHPFPGVSQDRSKGRHQNSSFAGYGKEVSQFFIHFRKEVPFLLSANISQAVNDLTSIRPSMLLWVQYNAQAWMLWYQDYKLAYLLQSFRSGPLLFFSSLNILQDKTNNNSSNKNKNNNILIG